MARVLIVGCGCRGRALASGLAERGLSVRGTTRDPARLAAIEAAGAEAVAADPDRLGTLLRPLEGVTVVCWLLATAAPPQLHDERLRSLLEKHNGNVTRSAQAAGLTRYHLRELAKRYGIRGTLD